MLSSTSRWANHNHAGFARPIHDGAGRGDNEGGCQQKKWNGYKASGLFKPFDEGVELYTIKDVIVVSPEIVFNQIKGWDWLQKTRWIIKDKDQLNASKFCSYHEYIGHNTNECHDLLK